MNKIFLNKTSNTVPIWLMRQAGRYMQEYQELRKENGSFLNLCYNPEAASTVTLQPMTRFDFDAAIIFSDILILPHALGWDLKFEEGEGPVMRQFKNDADLNLLANKDQNKLNLVYEAIERTRSKLAKTKSLIGFVGAPWTVATYLIEGRGKQDFSNSKKFITENTVLFDKLIDFLTEETILHLLGQIRAGADVIQIFDSWAGVLTNKDYENYVINPTRKIVDRIKDIYPQIPIIGFPKASGHNYEKYIENTNIDVIGVCPSVPIEIMRKWQKKIIVQGNLDPVILLTSPKIIANKVDELLGGLSRDNYIFNLGHGILQTTPVENVKFLVEYVRKF